MSKRRGLFLLLALAILLTNLVPIYAENGISLAGTVADSISEKEDQSEGIIPSDTEGGAEVDAETDSSLAEEEETPADPSKLQEEPVSSEPASEGAVRSEETTNEKTISLDGDQSSGEEERPVSTEEAVKIKAGEGYPLVEIDPVDEQELERSIPSFVLAPQGLRALQNQAGLSLNREGDGSKVERIYVEWITNDSDGTADGDPNLLSQIWRDNNRQNVRMRLNFSLSGQHDYEPGAIQITVPKEIFSDRQGKPIGNMTLAVPEAPDQTALFMYSEKQDSYLITNTKKLAAATSAMIEFTVHDLIPNEIVDQSAGYQSDPFKGYITVTTHAGNQIGLESNEITAQIDTRAQISGAVKKGYNVVEEWPSHFPEELKPDNPDDYIYLDWNVYAYSTANQNFKVTVEDLANPTGDRSGEALVLGYRNSRDMQVYPGNGTDRFSQPIYEGYLKDGHNFHGTVFVAYPKYDDQGNPRFEAGKVYELKNKVTYTMTSLDDQEVTRTSAEAVIRYSPVEFMFPRGHFIVKKQGYGEKLNGDTRHWLPGLNGGYKYEGIYSYALNQLRKGQAVDLSYEVENVAFGAPWTIEPGSDPTKLESYGQLPYEIYVEDFQTVFDYDLTMNKDYFQFKALRLTQPTIYDYAKSDGNMYGYFEDGIGGVVSYGKVPQGYFGYRKMTDSSQIPDMKVYGKTDGGEYVLYATVSYIDGKPTIQPENGASVVASFLVFPEEAQLTNYRVELETKLHGITWYMYPMITVKPHADILARVEELYQFSDTPKTHVSNTVKMDALLASKLTPINEDTGRDQVNGFAYGARTSKGLTYSNDVLNRKVDLHYSGQTTIQTNLAQKEDLQKVIDAGLFPEQKSGRWYDLLPAGVVPLVDTIKLRDGDQILDVQLIENYKGSGRILMIVDATLTPDYQYEHSRSNSITGDPGYQDVITIDFDAVYSWEALNDQGENLVNHLVFESGNESLGLIEGLRGEPDDPRAGRHSDSPDATKGVEDLLTDLNPDHDHPSFLYAKASNELVVDTSAVTSLSKTVDVNFQGNYGDGLTNLLPKNVYEGGFYSYRLRVQNSSLNSSSHLIFYDYLENYVPTEDKTDFGDARWRGSFLSIDIAELEQKGIKPVVYYSTTPGLVLDEESLVTESGNKGDLDLTNSEIWTTSQPRDKSTITAIAVDASKTTSGEDYVLAPGDGFSFYIRMQAPFVSDYEPDESKWADWYDQTLPSEDQEDGLAFGAHAYNNAVLTSIKTPTDTGVAGSNTLIRHDYTKVGLLPYHIEVKKSFEDANDRDGKRPESVIIRLFANGIDSGKYLLLSGDNDWQGVFENLHYLDGDGKRIYYSLVEDPVPGYLFIPGRPQPRPKGDGVVYSTINRHIPEMVDIVGEKIWLDEGPSTRPESITVQLYADGQLSQQQEVKVDINGNWAYSFTGLDKYKPRGQEIRYELVEQYVPGYISEVSPKGDLVTNRYYPYGNLTLEKTVSEGTPVTGDLPFAFTLYLYDQDGEPINGTFRYIRSDGHEGKIAHGGNLTLTDGQKVTVLDVPSETSYEWVETDRDGFELSEDSTGMTGDIRAGQTVGAEAMNRYTTRGSFIPQVKKVVKNRELGHQQFFFDVKDPTGEVLLSSSNMVDGDCFFGSIRYSQKDHGKTYTYTIEERQDFKTLPGYLYDTHRETVTVKVVDNGDGTMTITPTYDADGAVFTNIYRATGKLKLQAWKSLAGGFPLVKDQFSFELLDGQGKVVAKGTNDADGLIEFSPLSFTEQDIGKTFTYTAREVEGKEATVIYDTSTVKYTVTVVDNGDGTLAFETVSQDLNTKDRNNDPSMPVFGNRYQPGQLTVEKRIQGEGADPNKEFRFRVIFSGDEVPSGTVDLNRKKLTPLATGSSLAPMGFVGAGGVEPDPETSTEVDLSATEVTPEADRSAAEPEASFLAGRVPASAPLSTKAVHSLTYRPVSEGEFSYSLAKTANIRPALATNTENVVQPMAVAPQGKVVHTGTSGGVTWEIHDTGLLLLKPTNGVSGTLDNNGYGWRAYSDSILSVRVESGVKAGANSEYVFAHLSNATDMDLSNFDISQVKSLVGMFSGCRALSRLQGLEGWDVSHIQSIRRLFEGCESLADFDFLTNWDTGQVTNMMLVFDNCKALSDLSFLKDWETGSVMTMSWMFWGCTSLSNVDALLDWDTSRVTDFGGLFMHCRSLTDITGLSSWSTGNVEDMDWLFKNCPIVDLAPLVNWDTGNVQGMNYTFSNTSIESVDALSKWNTQNVTNMKYMFEGAKNLKSLDGLQSWNTGKVTEMTQMFNGCSSLTDVDAILDWDTVNVTTMKSLLRKTAIEQIDRFNLKIGETTDNGNLFEGTPLNSINLNQDFRFNGERILKVNYDSAKYTGNWIREDGTYGPYTYSKLAEEFNKNPGKLAGVWILEPVDRSYTVHFDGNGGQGTMTDEKAQANQDYTIPKNRFYRFGYRFTGWNTKADGSGTAYSPGTIAQNLTKPKSTANLYAQWKAMETTGNIQDGQLEFTLRGDEAVTIEDLPAGLSYEVYEETEAGWTLVEVVGDQGKIEPAKESTATFTNEYAAGSASAQIQGLKMLDNQPSSGFTFALYDAKGTKLQTAQSQASGSFTFEPLVYGAGQIELTTADRTTSGAQDGPKVYAFDYTVQEVPGVNAQINYDSAVKKLTVQVTDDGAGNLSTRVIYADPLQFSNTTRQTAYGKLAIKKEVLGGQSTGESFTIRLFLDSEDLPRTYSLSAGEEVLIENLPAGTGYRVEEVNLPSGYQLEAISPSQGTIASGSTITVTVTNRAPGWTPPTYSVNLEAEKILDGKSLEAGEFSFVLKDQGGKVLAEAVNSAQGKVYFDAIPLDKAGTYTYTIEEKNDGQPGVTYDSHKETVTVVAEDDGQGRLKLTTTYDSDGAVFTNRYNPPKKQPGSGSVSLEKKVVNYSNSLVNRKYTVSLSLLDKDGQALAGNFPYTSNKNLGGTVAHGGRLALLNGEKITIPDLPAGSRVSIEEEVPVGFVLDENSVVEAVVAGGQEAKLSLVNVYTPTGAWKVEAMKVLVGGNIRDHRYRFLLFADGEVIATAENEETGRVIFPELSFDHTDIGKTYQYQLVEEPGSDPYTVYDPRSYEISLRIEDDGQGKILPRVIALSCTDGTGRTVTLDKADQLLFTNKINVLPITGSDRLLGSLGLGLIGLLLLLWLERQRKKRVES